MAEGGVVPGKVDDKETIARLVVGTFNCALQLTQTRQITFTGHVYSDDTPEQINARVDLYQNVIDRQFVRCDIVNKEAQRTMHAQNLETYRLQLADLADRQAKRKKGDASAKLNGQEMQTLQNADRTIATIQKEIEKLDVQIAEAKRKVGIST